MRRIVSLLSILLIFTTSIWSQRKTQHEVGGGINLSMMNSDYGEVPGMGVELRHGLNFKDGHFVIKSNLGFSSFTRRVMDGFRISDGRIKSQDYIFNLGVSGEYNLKSIKNFYDKGIFFWTPYISVGPQLIYRSTAAWGSNEASSGFYPVLKSGLGIKFKINTNMFLTAEYSYNWDFFDNLDSREVEGSANDNFSTLSVGFTHSIAKKRSKYRSPWSGF